MIVFSNTTPIIALSSINKLDLLPALFNEINLVDTVVEECSVGGKIIVPDLNTLSWINIVKYKSGDNVHALIELDKGEKHTLNMAVSMNADLVIIDEKIGRNLAEYIGLHVTGTLGILLKAKQQGKIASFAECVSAMQKQGIRYNSKLIMRLAKQVGETFHS